MTQARITGTGMYLPETVLTNKDLEAFCDTSDEWIRQRTGIEERHRVTPGEGTSDLALPASQMAIENAGIAPHDLEAIICCTLTPDQLLPGSANILHGKLGVKDIASFDINAACSGFMAGLMTGDALIRAGVYKTILLVGAEIQTNRMTWANRDTAVLFADGAGAVILQASENGHGVLTTRLGSDGSSYKVLHLPRGGARQA